MVSANDLLSEAEAVLAQLLRESLGPLRQMNSILFPVSMTLHEVYFTLGGRGFAACCSSGSKSRSSDEFPAVLQE